LEPKWTFLLVALFLLFSILVFSCEEDNSDDAGELDYHQLMSLGKFYLEHGDGYTAADYFEMALVKEPESIEAKYAVVVSGPMIFMNFFDRIMGTIDALSFAGVGVEGKSMLFEYEKPKSDGNQIHLYLHDKIIKEMVSVENAYLDIENEDVIRLSLDGYVLILLEDELLRLGGEFDNTDFYLFGAANSLVNGAIKLLLAHNLYFDYTMLVLPEIPTDGDVIETIDPIIELLDNLLHSVDFPDFLKLVKGTGARNMQLAAIDLGLAFVRFRQTIESLGHEAGGQNGHQITYVDVNENGRYNVSVDSLKIGPELVLEADIVAALMKLSGKLAPGFFEGSDMDRTPDVVDFITPADFTDILTALEIMPFIFGSVTIENLPEYPRINVGDFFANPTKDGLRNFLLSVISIWNILFQE